MVANSATAALYLTAATSLWRDLGRPRPSGAAGGLVATWLTVPALILHGAVLAGTIFVGAALHFGFAHALSATLWLAALAVWIESFILPLSGLLVIVLPLAALAVPLPLLFGGAVILDGGDTLALRLHLSAAILAYSLLTIAALHALLMAAVERVLHEGGVVEGIGGRLLARIPPLLALEGLLFRLIAAGFVLLTVTVLTGVVFSEELFGRPVRFDHKTDLALVSWIVFAALLVGRHGFGWRGRTALRWTLAGFATLLLAYVGSRFVEEVILRRF